MLNRVIYGGVSKRSAQAERHGQVNLPIPENLVIKNLVIT